MLVVGAEAYVMGYKAQQGLQVAISCRPYVIQELSYCIEIKTPGVYIEHFYVGNNILRISNRQR